MARSPDMLILDKMEIVLADKVCHFKCSGAPLSGDSGTACLQWDRRPLKVDVNNDRVLGTTSVMLREEDPHALLKSFKITGMDSSSLVVKPDHFSVQHFQASTFNKACDYLLLTKFEGEKYAIFIDLKTDIFEDPDKDSMTFRFNEAKDEEIVWQMIGSDAILDGLADVLSKKLNKVHQSFVANRNQSRKGGLAEFSRRYLILYMKVNRTGEPDPSPTSPPPAPNIFSLEKPIHVMKVEKDCTGCDIGGIFANARLER